MTGWHKAVETCPHGVKRELLFKDNEIRAFMENCGICQKQWEKEGEGHFVFWMNAFIGQTMPLRERL
jgi:hypothetical protein